MSASLGRVTAKLAEPAEQVSADLVELINKNVNPPTPIVADDVFVRAMYIVSDEVNSFGGRFPVEEHKRLVELLIDSPVMVGHRKDKLPIARNFHAGTVERENRQWVKSYFYWLKSAQGADNLRENIDGGIYKECSIGFTFLMPECSVCKKDIRTCEHEPLAEYEVDGEQVSCHFNYRKIERVLETSLVYRGAVNDTSVSKELKAEAADVAGQSLSAEVPAELKDLSELSDASQCLVTPYYDGLMVRVSMVDGQMRLCRLDGELLGEEFCNRFDLDQLAEYEELCGLLVPYRGKERLKLSALSKLLSGQPSHASRLELKLVPQNGLDPSNLSRNGRPDRIRVLRHEVVASTQVDEAARSVMTRDGVRVWSLDELPPQSLGYRYCPHGGKQSLGSYRVCRPAWLDGMSTGSDDLTFIFAHEGERGRFVVRQGNQARLARGARFVADEVPVEDVTFEELSTMASGRLVELSRQDGGYLLRLSGALEGWFALRRIKLEGRTRFLFYRRSVS
ncbi:MAG: hypothetical protein OEV49_07550 [candidate division Zixibacteria bacterium]|nr:hypothetical protein [candidate division Zixibacteria bacterium]MDH3936078.1 hypothetical protein [candidate division Zixibacteria bacterium]MDH4032224.1 hypothetical protein [candidate division Zixibacteria bacterium]